MDQTNQQQPLQQSAPSAPNQPQQPAPQPAEYAPAAAQQPAPQPASPQHYVPAQQPYYAPAQPAYSPIQPAPLQTAPTQPQQVKQPSGWARLWAALALAFAVVIIQAIAMIFGMISHNDEGLLTVGEIAGGIAAMLFVFALGGKKLALPSLEGMGETWRIVRWLFLVDAVIAVIDTVSIVTDGSFELAQMWYLRVFILLLMCAGIGLFEEMTFRGLIFHGLLSRMGTNKKGIFWAVIISSVFFGLMHIDPLSMDASDPSQVAQAILKVAQTGIFGFVAAAAVLKTGNIWPIAIVHALNDFMLMFVENGLMASPVSMEYVTSGEEGLLAIAIYIALCAAYIPSLVVAWRTLRDHPAPDRGQFYRPRVVSPGVRNPAG